MEIIIITYDRCVDGSRFPINLTGMFYYINLI